MNDEFYIGWESKAPKGIGRTARKTVMALLILAGLLAGALAVSQRIIGASVFEWGKQRNFSGILQLDPYPHLFVARPGEPGDQPAFSTYYLVAQWKFGLDHGVLAQLDGKRVVVKGTLIYRNHETMIETGPDWIRADEKSAAPPLVPQLVALGRQTVTGEIVDSKCFFGVMNPGELAPHRACAVRCISGGVPPVLVAKHADGTATCFMLVSAEGKPVNKQVLGMIAVPLEITGEVERQGELLILRADPATYHKL